MIVFLIDTQIVKRLFFFYLKLHTHGAQIRLVITRSNSCSIDCLLHWFDSDHQYNCSIECQWFIYIQYQMVIRVECYIRWTLYQWKSIHILLSNTDQYQYHNRLFTFFVLKVFDLLFLIIKFLFVWVFRAMLIRLHFHLSIKIQVNPTDDLTMVIVKNNDPLSLDKQIWT